MEMATAPAAGQLPSAVKPRSFYRPELDALRFFACFAVFAHHVGSMRKFLTTNRFAHPVFQAGGFGVCLFFLLSAYLITELLWKERDKSGSIHLRSFYVRRILRIWPLYFFCILLYIVLTPFYPRFPGHGGALISLVVMGGNWYFAAFGWPNYALAPMWSISVEEQFYLVVPTIAKLGGKRAVWIASILFLIASQVTLAWLGHRHATATPTIAANSFVQFAFFAGGSILALVLKNRAVDLPGIARWGLFVAGAAAWCIAAGPLKVLGVPGNLDAESAAGMCLGYALVLAGCLLIFFSFYNLDRRWIPGWAVYLGKISFGLYLFHGFALEASQNSVVTPFIERLKHKLPVADILFEAACTVLLASLSYRFLETPFLRLKDRFAVVHSRPV
jgi:peptidoglycan/LPS O-acetylase OafA/YrhL